MTYDILTPEGESTELTNRTDEERPNPCHIETKREPNNEVLVGLFYAFIGTFSYGLISVLVTMTSALNFSPFYLLLIRAVFQVVFFSVINLIRSKGERDAELKVVELAGA